MRWIWHEWNYGARPWVGLGNPCTSQDKELFAVTTQVTVGNGKKTLFWTPLLVAHLFLLHY
jgi:hypothetical protein